MPITAAEIAFRRAIAKQAGRRVAVRRLPRPKHPSAALLRYTRLLAKQRKTLGGYLREVIFPALPELVKQGAADRGGLRQDSAASDIVRVFSNFKIFFADTHPYTSTQTELSEVARSANATNAANFAAQIKAATGIPLITPEPFLQGSVDAFLQSNADLVTSLSEGQIERFKQITARGVQSGLRVESIRDQLLAELDITKGKASLLARDQTLRFYGELSELRQTNVGISEYIWDTSQDERVRPTHAELHGTKHNWGDPPIVAYATAKRPERRAHPGQDYQCRCNPIPVIPEEWFAAG